MWISGVDNVDGTDYIMDMNKTRRTNCRGFDGNKRCRKAATHLVTGGDWFCERHAARYVELAQTIAWTRGATMWPASAEDIAEIADTLGRKVR